MYVIKQFAIPFYAFIKYNIIVDIYPDNYLQLGCCAQATLAAPAFANCPTTEPCTTPFSLSRDSNGGSPSINSMATMFTSFLLATVALLFHS